MEKNLNINVLFKEERKRIDLGEGEIIIYNPTEKIINEIWDLQEEYYKEYKDVLPDRILLLEVMNRVTNLNFDVDNEIIIEKYLDNPPLWFKVVKEEIKGIILDINKLKNIENRNTMKEMQMIVEQLEDNVDIPQNVKEYFKQNEEDIIQMGDKEFIESAQVLGLIENKQPDEEELKREELIKKKEQYENQLKQLNNELNGLAEKVGE